MAWQTPIFDRTNEDVLKVQTYDTIGFKYLTDEQKAEWLAGLKGAWNYKDVNRLEGNCKFLAELYEIRGMTFTTNWGYTNIVNETSAQRIIDNINKLRETLKVLPETPETPELPLNTYQKINDLEKIIYDMYWVFENGSLAFSRDDEIYKSELYSGDDIAVI